MSYSIIFKTKIVNLPDGRLLHLSLAGSNNDDHGRNPGDWDGKIYTVDEFDRYAGGFMERGKPEGKSPCFDLKIGSRKCSLYDYGKHLTRMKKRAVTLDELRRSSYYVSFTRADGTPLKDEKDIMDAFDTGSPVRIYIA